MVKDIKQWVVINGNISISMLRTFKDFDIKNKDFFQGDDMVLSPSIITDISIGLNPFFLALDALQIKLIVITPYLIG